MKAINFIINLILTTQRNCLEPDVGFTQGEQLLINSNKINWETFNTPKIRTVFYSSWRTYDDFGTRIRLKCHRPMNRQEKTLDGELCTNWELIDSFGVRLDYELHRNFYDDPHGNNWEYPGKRL